MSPTHECKQETRIEDVETQADRIEKEIYVGREGRQPILIRVDRCERIAAWLTYVSTALLITTLCAVASVVWQAVIKSASGH